LLFQLFTFPENVIILFAELGVCEVFVLINLYYFFGVTSYFMFNQRNFRQLFQPLSAVIDFERKVFSGDVFIRYIHALIMKDIPAKTTDKYRQNPTRKIA
jgi:hypothetical protein